MYCNCGWQTDSYAENNIVYCAECKRMRNALRAQDEIDAISGVEPSDPVHLGHLSYLEYLALRNDPEKLKQRARENKRRDDELQQMFTASDICPHCGQDL